MVIETDMRPLLEWLLGPGWHQGALYHWLPMTVAVALAALVVGCLAAAARRRPAALVRIVNAVIAAGVAVLGVVLLALAARWLLPAGWTRPLIDPLLAVVGWLLGAGWSQGAVFCWLWVIASAAVVGLLACWLLAAARRGPVSAWAVTSRLLAAGLEDLLRTSPRRVWALTRLAVQESIRRKVVVAFLVFVVVLLFAGWFLDPGSERPARLYLGFVLNATSYLVLLLILFLSSLSLPADIKNRTLQTVVTKPVRKSEIVLGRICGFTVIGTSLLALMGMVSYLFVVRGLAHTHELTEADLHPVANAAAGRPAAGKGITSRVHHHRHEVVVSPSGDCRVVPARRHWHEVTVEKSAGGRVYKIGRQRGMLVARVPVYGKLRFKDRAGKDAEKGINVGDEWTYRSYIEGGTAAAAIWTFEGISEENFPDGLPLEMTLGVFRTHKGDIEKTVMGSLAVRNPRTGRESESRMFSSQEFATKVVFVPRGLQTAKGEKLDLFEDLAADGRLEIWLRCEEAAQYFGAAQPDLYLRARNAPFTLNFAKGYLGIWLQMELVIGAGVMFSTFLSGPVAMIATLGTLMGGMFRGFMVELAAHKVYGGGPIEALIRLVTQQNVTSEMEPGLRTTAAQTVDKVLESGLSVVAAMLPEFGRFDLAKFVAGGFDIPADVILSCVFQAAGFLLPVFVAGYFFLKTREVAR